MISTDIRRAGPYATNGSQVAFEFSFKVFESSDLRVLFAVSGDPEVDVDAGDYTVTLNLDQDTEPGGEIVFAVPPVDGLLSIISDMLIEQPAVFSNTGNFYPRVLNDALDRATIGIQQLDEKVDRAVIAPVISDSQLGYFPVLDGQGGFAFLPPDEVGGVGADPTLRVELATSTGLALVGTPDGTAQANLNTRPVIVDNRTALKALNVTRYSVAYLAESGREGIFILRAGSVPTDAQEGIYADSDTASFYWEREWDGIHGKPEWFGAVTNSSSGGVPAANLTAIAACVTLCPVTLLEKADYFISNVWKFTETVSRKTIRGVAGAIDTQGDATRVVLTGANAATAKVLQVGPDSMPATYPSNVPYELHFHDIVFMRNAAVTPGATVFDGVRGVSVQGALGCTFHNIKSVDSAIGFYITGAVNCHFDGKCQSHRATAGTSPTNDYTVGWMLGGVAANFGFAGANASVYLANPIATVSTSVSFADTFGLYAFGYIADTFITDLEMTSFNKGGIVDGQSITTAGAQANFTLNNPRFDAYGSNGLEINNLNSTANVDVSNPYFGPLSTGDYGLRIYNTNGGPVKVRGGVVAAYYTNPAGFIGLALDTTQGVMVDALALIDCDKPAVISNSFGYDIKPHINNPNHTGADVAVAFVNTNARGRCDPIVRGKAAAFTVGVSYAGTASNNTETGLSAINPGCLTASSANNKIFYNGSTTVGTTPFGTGNLYLGSVT